MIPEEVVLKRLKDLASERFSGINVFTSWKHCWNKHGTAVNLFIHEYQINWVQKILP